MTEKDGRVVEMDRALKSGHISFWLEGRKLKGGYAITKTTRGWILVKMNDELADASEDILIAEPSSVLSGRTIESVSDVEGLEPK
jgi:hypothetical protein